MTEPKSMIVAGVMSGTSADGVDVAFARISPGRDQVPRIKPLSHTGFRYPKAIREAVLRAATGEMKVAELSQLNWRLGEIYADCIAKASAAAGAKPSLIGLHGQTIYHQAVAAKFAGSPIRATWQIGQPAVIRERLGVPVISNFRAADLAAGGQGAPLVPMLDFCLFRSKTRNRVLLNLGGISNLTAIPAAANLDSLLAFDTGPANMIVDGLMQHALNQPFDRGGRLAAKGRVLPEVVAEMMRNPYFAASPPKSCGREQFGAACVVDCLVRCGGDVVNALASATELSAVSILDAYSKFCWSHLGQRAPLARGTDLIVAGGGVLNKTLMHRLRQGFEALGVKLLIADDLGLAAQAKEAVAFALLAWLSLHGLPGNVPSATGASHPTVLGSSTC